LLSTAPYRVCLLWFTEPFQLAFKSLKPGRGSTSLSWSTATFAHG